MRNIEEKLQLYQVLSSNAIWRCVLQAAIKVEEEGEMKWSPYFGWQWFQVHCPAQTLNKMVTEGLLDITTQSRSSTYYKIKERELLKEALESIGEGVYEESAPIELFDTVVGHERIKWAFKMSLQSEKPVHILLVGPVATAKTLFLQDLSKLPGSRYVLGSASSRAGIIDYLLEYRPRYLIIDEIEKSDGRDLSALLSLMQTGIVTRMKKGMREQTELTTWVFAGANGTSRIPKELLSRFMVVHLNEYTVAEFVEICECVLEKEGVDSTISTIITKKILPYTRDVRDAVKIGRLAKSVKDVEELVGLLFK